MLFANVESEFHGGCNWPKVPWLFKYLCWDLNLLSSKLLVLSLQNTLVFHTGTDGVTELHVAPLTSECFP